MARAIEGIDWAAIEKGWCNGVTAEELSALHGATVTNIRTRAFRKQWVAKNPSATKTVVAKAAKLAVNRAVAKATARIEKRAEATVEACIEESIRLGQSFMQRAQRSIEEVEDGNLSGVATLGRTGVDMWRKSLGLDTTGSGSASCGISFSFVMRQDGSPTLHATRSPMGEPVTIDAEEVVPQ